ncbi:hypothetical protein TH53_24480 [Pedobacter lusitanus]|uniref:Outer membrane protein beta-barrel domain-containing protein n=1 Tax=Pedobacter lusitanus TaxID=1503925 RepID=A0A0D0GBX7_9SPHI|nr:hypothetical protein [Pedobacter lusitanus]KIO74777.1 hypothetical protein TH53_24480 [Pedobacter lusitanus]
MEHPKKELIKEIADLFEDYQETYVPGEWESFSKVKKKKYPFAANWVKIAAVLLLMAGLPFAFTKLFHQEKTAEVAVIKPPVQTSPASPVADQVNPVKPVQGKSADIAENRAGTMSSSSTAGDLNSNAGTQTEPAKRQADLAYAVRDTTVYKKIQQVNTERTLTPGQKKDGQKNMTEQYVRTEIKPAADPEAGRGRSSELAGVKEKDTAATQSRKQLSTAEFLLAESRNTGKVLKKKENVSKWDFGVEVMPATTSANVNIGAGLTTAYRISDKFSLSTGISYLQMDAGGVIPPQPDSYRAAGISAFSDKKLLAVDANLKAIDIPIALVYKLNKNYYTSAGVSYFSVFSEKRSNTFEQTSPVDKMSYDPDTGHPSTFKSISVEEVDEPVMDKHLKGNSYIGFFNFSIGRQQNIFNKYKIRIEPFVKIPVGKLSSEDLKLTNSGIKFQLSF